MKAPTAIFRISEKDEAKALGAKWDPSQKRWYVPDGGNAELFKKWIVEEIPEESIAINIRADHYYIATSSRECWKCKKETKVFAFILPKGFQALYTDENDNKEFWQMSDAPSTLTYITKMPVHAKRALTAITKNFFRDHSNIMHSDYWMNHCEHCRALLGDFDTIEDSDSFTPLSASDAQRIRLLHFAAPFEGAASHSSFDTSMQFFDFMKCI